MKTARPQEHCDKSRPTQIATDVARLARSYLGDGIDVIWFGSWPKGTALPRSDIDIAVSTGAPIPLERMSPFLEAVEQLPTLYQVDIVDFHSVGAALRHEIERHGEHL